MKSCAIGLRHVEEVTITLQKRVPTMAFVGLHITNG